MGEHLALARVRRRGGPGGWWPRPGAARRARTTARRSRPRRRSTRVRAASWVPRASTATSGRGSGASSHGEPPRRQAVHVDRGTAGETAGLGRPGGDHHLAGRQRAAGGVHARHPGDRGADRLDPDRRARTSASPAASCSGSRRMPPSGSPGRPRAKDRSSSRTNCAEVVPSGSTTTPAMNRSSTRRRSPRTPMGVQGPRQRGVVTSGRGLRAGQGRAPASGPAPRRRRRRAARCAGCRRRAGAYAVGRRGRAAPASVRASTPGVEGAAARARPRPPSGGRRGRRG